MKIFLDTNIFYNDWFMKNANFKYLFNYINNEGHSLILSELVVEEVENIRNRELTESLAEIKKNIKKAQKMNFDALNFDSDNLGIENYDLKDLLKSKTEYLELLGYEEISHSEVVGRALINKKPFIEGEKGYRDTLIWLSFLAYIVKNEIIDDVAFITQNTSDFFKTKDTILSFHPDLSDDIDKIKSEAKIIPFTSLFEFINSNVDKDTHAIDYDGSEEIFEDFITDSASDYLGWMSNTDLSIYFESSIFDTKVREILDIRVDVSEGLEDPEILQTRRLENNDIYISYKYNLRRVTLEIDIPKIAYVLNKDVLDEFCYEVIISADIATMNCLVRPYFDVSFIYNDKNESLKSYEVANLWLRF